MNNSSTESPHHDNEHHHVHVVLYLFGILSTSWTIVANSGILVVFYRNRRRQWTSFSRQVCSFTLGDMLVGVLAVPILVMEKLPAEAHTYRCLTTFYLYFSIQCVTYLHVLGICIFRNLRITTPSETVQTPRHVAYANCVITISWVVSFGAILLPFIIWSSVDERHNLCYINNLFGNHRREGMLYIKSVYFISQVLTNIIYIITCIRLRRALRTILPVDNVNVNASVPDTVAVSRSSDASYTRPFGSRMCTQTASMNQQLTSILKKQVIVTIGILLLMFNIFTLPLTMVFFVERSQPLDRNVRFLGAIMFMMNSGLNPIVYATRITSIKEAINVLFRDISGTT